MIGGLFFSSITYGLFLILGKKANEFNEVIKYINRIIVAYFFNIDIFILILIPTPASPASRAGATTHVVVRSPPTPHACAAIAGPLIGFVIENRLTNGEEGFLLFFLPLLIFFSLARGNVFSGTHALFSLSHPFLLFVTPSPFFLLFSGHSKQSVGLLTTFN